MKISEAAQASALHHGTLVVQKDGEEFVAKFSSEAAVEAASVVLEHEGTTTATSQAEVIARAISDYSWGIGSSGYTAYAPSTPLELARVR